MNCGEVEHQLRQRLIDGASCVSRDVEDHLCSCRPCAELAMNLERMERGFAALEESYGEVEAAFTFHPENVEPLAPVYRLRKYVVVSGALASAAMIALMVSVWRTPAEVGVTVTTQGDDPARVSIAQPSSVVIARVPSFALPTRRSIGGVTMVPPARATAVRYVPGLSLTLNPRYSRTPSFIVKKWRTSNVTSKPNSSHRPDHVPPPAGGADRLEPRGQGA